jgi:hypothetical protein
LESDYIIRIPGKQIDNLSLAFVTPLGTYYNHIGHLYSPKADPSKNNSYSGKKHNEKHKRQQT